MSTLIWILQTYIETILEIIEDTQEDQKPLPFFYILIFIFTFQNIGYLFSHFEGKLVLEELASYLARIGEIAPGTFLLYYKGNDTLTLITFFGVLFINIFYYLYIAIVIYLKSHHAYYLMQNQTYFKFVNKYLNIFFTFFWWVFFVPFFEINIGIFICGINSFLISDRNLSNDECEANKPWILRVLSVVGMILTFFTAGVIIVFFRNHKFNEENKLKKRYSPFNSLIQLGCRAGIMISYYIGTETVRLPKHFIGYIFVLAVLGESLFDFPFASLEVTFFYIFAITFFLLELMITSIWLFTNSLQQTDIFYPIVFFGLLASYLNVSIYKRVYFNLMINFSKNNQNTLQYTDYYVEQLNYLVEDNMNQESQILLLQFLLSHQQKCNDVKCQCQSNSDPLFRYQRFNKIKSVEKIYKDEQNMTLLNKIVDELNNRKSNQTQTMTSPSSISIKAPQMIQSEQQEKLRESIKRKSQIEIEDLEVGDNTPSKAGSRKSLLSDSVPEQQDLLEAFDPTKSGEGIIQPTSFYRLLTDILKASLQNPLIIKSTSLFEQLSLKYISFLAKYRMNAARSYFELKNLTRKPELSFYFMKLSLILSTKIQNMMQQQQSVQMNQDQEQEVQQQTIGRNLLKVMEGFEHTRPQNDQSNKVHEFFDLKILMEVEIQHQEWREIAEHYLKQKLRYWQQLSQGIKSIQLFQEISESLTQQLSQFQKNFKRILEKCTHYESINNLLHFKIQCVTAFAILNDIQLGIKFQQKVTDYYHKDNQKGFKELSILKYTVNEAVIVHLSVMQHKGRILNNQSHKLAQFFKFTDTEDFSKVTNIKELMTPLNASIHDSLIDRYLKRGYSNLMGKAERDFFIKAKDGFIQQVQAKLGSYFSHQDDFTMIASLLKENQENDFIICDFFGQICGVSQKLFLMIKEKYLLLRNSKDEQSFTLEQFLRIVNIFMIFPELISTFQNFLQEIGSASGGDGVDPHYDFIIDTLLANKVNEMTVGKNQKVSLVVRSNLFEYCEHYFQQIEELIKNDDSSMRKLREQFLKKHDTFQTPKIGLSSTYKQLENQNKQKQNTIQPPPIGLSLLSMLELNEIQSICESQKYFQEKSRIFKYYSKVDIKCIVLAQGNLYSYNEIYFTIQINELKITKDTLYSLLQSKSRINTVVNQAVTQTFDELKLLKRGLTKPINQKNPFDKNGQFDKNTQSLIQDDNQNLSIEERGRSKEQRESLQKSLNQMNSFPNVMIEEERKSDQQLFNQYESSDSSSNDSADQIEENITLKSSLNDDSQFKIENRKNLNEIAEQQSIATATSGSYKLTATEIIKQITSKSNRQIIGNNFLLLNFFNGLTITVFIIFFALFQIMIKKQMDGILLSMSDFQCLKKLHITYGSALFGGLGLFELEELNIFDLSKISNLSIKNDQLNEIFHSYIVGTFDEYTQSVNDNYNYIIENDGGNILQPDMRFDFNLTLENQSQTTLNYFDLISNKFYELEMASNVSLLDMNSFYFLYKNLQLHTQLQEQLLNENQNSLMNFQDSGDKYIQIYLIIVIILLIFPIPVAYYINNRLNKYYSQILNIIARIGWNESINQAYLIQQTIHLLTQQSEAWAYYDFKQLFTVPKKVIEKSSSKGGGYDLTTEKLTSYRIVGAYTFISFYFISFFLIQCLYYRNIINTIHVINKLSYQITTKHQNIVSLILQTETQQLQYLIPQQYQYLYINQTSVQGYIDSLRSFVYINLQNQEITDLDSQGIVQSILQSDLCALNLPMTNISDICQDHTGNKYFQQGLSSVVTSILKIASTDNIGNKEFSLNYFQSNDHIYLFWMGFKHINQSFNKLLNNLYWLTSNYISNSYQNLLLIWYIVGALGLLVFICVGKQKYFDKYLFLGIYLFYKIKDQTKNHIMMLTLLPYPLLKDNTTVHLLKQVQKFE